MSTFTSGEWQQKAYDIITSGKLSSAEAEYIAKVMWDIMDSPFFSRVLQELEADLHTLHTTKPGPKVTWDIENEV